LLGKDQNESWVMVLRGNKEFLV